MEYDGNEFQRQNLQLGGEGCSSVLHPKFEFDDLLSLVENEVFLGTTSEEDNQRIEDYSRGGNGIELSSSSKRRCDNVWSEATCVEMLIKSSVGQEAETVIDVCGSLTKIMDPSLNQDDGELGSVVVLSKDCNLSVSEAEESTNKELPEELKVQKQEVSAADKDNNSIMIMEKSQCDAELSEISIPFNEPSQELKDNNNNNNNNNNNMYEEEGSLAAVHKNSVLNVDSLSKIKNPSAHQITPPETGSTHVDCKSALRHADQDCSLSLPLETSDMDIDNQKNVEPFLSVEDSKDKTPNFESHVLDRVDQVAAMESDGSHLLLSTPETNDQPKSPIFGVSLAHQEKVQVGFPCDCEDNGSSQIQSVVASSSLKEASSDMAEKIDSHCPSSLVENCNANQIEIEPESNTNTSNMSETDSLCESSEEKRGNSCVAGGQLESVIEEVNKHHAFVDVDCPSKCDIGQDGGSFSSLEKPQLQLVSQSAKDKQKTTNEDSPLPCKTTDDDVQPGSSSKATQEEKNLTFEVNASAGKSYPTFQVSMIVEGTSRDSSSGQVDARISSQIKGKGKSVRKPRRKSVGRKDKQLKETTPVRVVEESSVVLTPPATGQFFQPDENAERSGGGVLPDLNNSTTPVFQQPFTDNQQLQLRAQILVYGSLISGSLPEQPHMIASFGQSDGGRSGEGVWRAWHHVKKKAQAIANTQSRSFDQGVKQASVQNNNSSKGIPLWSIADSLKSEDYQTPAVAVAVAVAVGPHNNPCWLSQAPGPFAAARFSESKHPPTPDPKSRKRKKGCAPVLPEDMVSADSVTAAVKFLFPSDDGKMMVISSEETLSKVEESKIQAADAAEHAAAAVSHCHGIWRQLERHNCSDGDDEAKLVSSAVSVAAAASVAKVAAAAAKIASDVAEQMVRLFLVSNKSQNFDEPAIAASENLDAIVKAAAEMVSEAGKAVAMSEPLPLRHLVEAGPEGYWKSGHPLIAAGSLNGKERENQTNNKRKSPKSVDDTCIAGQPNASDNSKENNNIKEGCLVEVCKDDGAWYGAHVLSLKDGKALVCYMEIQSNEGGPLKEWVALEVESNEVPPKTRVAHPLTLKGTKKRSRTDFVWSSGDRVDVWIQDGWREGVVMETNRNDPSRVRVKFSGEGETSIVGSWFVRPTLIWKDGKWVECHTWGQEKRMKLESCEQKSTTQTQTLPLSSVGQGQGQGPPRGVSKQKFMDVSKHHHHDSVKFTRYLIPQAPARAGIGMKNNNNNSSRKPPIPSFKSDQQNQMNKRKFESADAEPSRRSNRKIQPTSRLLEGLQTSITVSKIPAFTHTKATPKDNTNTA